MKFFKSICTDQPSVIIPLKYFYIADQTDNAVIKIAIEWSCDEHSCMPVSAKLDICRSNDEATENEEGGFYKWAGFPEFIQSNFQPISDDGRLYHYICTIQNDWGDMGNANVFALLGGWKDDRLIVEDVFVEASCH
jgi:hypothetical protein